MLGGIFWFSRNHYQNYYDRMKHQAWVVSSLIKSNLASSISRSQPYLQRQIFSKKTKEMVNSFSEIRALFLLNPLTSQIVAHSKPNFSGRSVRDVYPSLNTEVSVVSGKAGVLKDFEIDRKKTFEYKYFYRYAIPDQMKHPLYIVNTLALKNKFTGRTVQNNLYLVWNTPLDLLFTWTDFLLYAFVITHISFLLSYLLNKSFQSVLSEMQETKIEKTKKPGKAREFNQMEKPYAPDSSGQKIHKQQTAPQKRETQPEVEKKPTAHSQTEAAPPEPARKEEEEIPEAIFLD